MPGRKKKRSLLFHGTSATQLERLAAAGWRGKDLYVGDSQENIADNYATMQAERDDTDPVVIGLDRAKLKKHGTLEPDFHEDERQEGQFIFNGNLKPAIVSVSVNWEPLTSGELKLLLR